MIAEVGEQARLVDDHVRELRQALLGVLNALGTRDPGWLLRVRPPKGHLVDPIRLADETVGQTERFEHLDRTTGDPVGLTNLERTIPSIDDRGPNIGEVGQLRGQHQAGWTAPDDQHVDLLREASNSLRD